MIGGGLYNIYIIIYIYIYYIVSLNFPHRNETPLAIVDLQGKVDLQQLSQRMADGASWCQEVPPDTLLRHLQGWFNSHQHDILTR